MCDEYRKGNPSIEEWEGLWKCDDQGGDVTEDEFYAAYRSLRKFISTIGRSGIEDDCDFYVRGDPYGDKTQHIEIVDPHVLTVEFLRNLQRWIQESYPAWRIVVPTFIAPKAVIVVYKDAIRFTREYEADLAVALSDARDKMLLLEEYKHARRT